MSCDYDNAPTDPAHGGKFTFNTWAAKVLTEWKRLNGDGHHEAVMFFDHATDALREMYADGVAPIDAAKALMFDDESM